MMKSLLLFVCSLHLVAGVDDGWKALVSNQFPEAREAFAQTMAEDDLAAIGWFLTHSGNGPTEELSEAAATVLRRDPSAPAAEFVLKWMENYKECLDTWVDSIGPILQDVETDNPELRVFIANNLRMRSRNYQDVPQFEATAAAAGFLTRWHVSPRYGAYPIPAFYEKDWAPHKGDWSGGKDVISRTGVLLPPLHAQGRGIFYAAANFELAEAGDVIFRLFSYQNIAIYVDGKYWRSYRHQEELGPNVNFFRANLPAGRHEVVIKTTQTQTSDGQFSLQLTGKGLKQLDASVPSIVLEGQNNDVEDIQVGLAASLSDRDGGLAELVRAFLSLLEKDTEVALTKMEALAEVNESSKLIGGAIARIYISGVSFLPRDVQGARAYQYLSRLAMAGRENNLENLLTLGLLLQQARQQEQALQLIEGVSEANPGFCEALEARLLLAREKGLKDIERQTLKRMEDLGTEHRWAQNKLLEAARRDGDLERKRELLMNLAELLPWEGYVAQLNEMDEDYEAAIKDLQKRYAVFSDRDYYPFTIAQAYAQLGDRENQREWLEKTMEVNPLKREALLDLVNLDCLEGKAEDAKARLRAYLQIEPADAFFRQRLSHLEGETAFEAFRVEAEQVIEEAKNKPMTEGADSELLLDQLMVRLFPDGSQMRYTHLVRRVLTKKGVDEESELNLSDNLEILNLRTVKEDGTVLFPADIDHKSSISLSGVSVGDFIDEEHIEYIAPAYYDADGLSAEMTFIFQGVDRVYHHSELVLIYPSDLPTKPELREMNLPIEHETIERDGLTIVRWLARDMPPLKEEPNMPFRAFSQPTATFYYNTSWDEIRDFYGHVVASRMGLSDRIKRHVETWGVDTEDQLELAKKIYAEVADRCEGQNMFTNINQVWETRKGNPTLLMAAIYKHLGFDVDVVMAQVEEMRHYSLNVPQPTYNYALLRLKLDGQTYWLDASQPALAFDYIPNAYNGGRGLVLGQADELFIDLPNRGDELERTVAQYNLYFRADGSVAALATDTFYGAIAATMTEGFKKLNTPEIRNRVEVGINQDYPGSSVSNVTISEDQPRGTFRLLTEFNHKSFARKTDEGLEMGFPMKKTDLLEKLGSLPTRETPLRIGSPIFAETALTVMVPEGFAWKDIEVVNLQEENDFGHYRLEILRKKDRELEMKRSVYLKKQLIDPEDYAGFLAFLQKMSDFENRGFVAVKEP